MRRGRRRFMILKNVMFWGSCLVMIGLLIAIVRMFT